MNHRPKLCFVITGTGVGGAERHLFEVIRRIDRSRFKLAVISLKRTGPIADELGHERIPVYSADLPEDGGPKALFYSAAAFARLLSLLRQMKPDLVQTLCLRADVLGRIAARMAGVPCVVGSFRIQERGNGLRTVAARLTAGACDRHVACSRALVAEASARYDVHPSRVTLIDNGIDLSRVVDCRPATDLGAGSPMIGTIGRMHRQKGHDTLLEATVILRRYHPGLRTVIVGTGPHALPTLRRSQRMGLEDYVYLPGNRDDIGEVLAALDVFVLPSRYEGMPNALLEAMGAGRPVVATDIPGVDEIVTHEVDGLLVPPDRPALLADAIDRLVQDRELAARLGAAAQRRVSENHRVDLTAQRYQDLYARLLGMPPAEAPASRAETLLV